MLHRFYVYLLRNQVILALFLIVLGWFILQLRGIIMSIFLSYILMAALLPAVSFLRKKKFPMILAAFIPFFFASLLVFLIILPLIPFIIDQIGSLAIGLPDYLNKSANTLGLSVNANDIQSFITREINNIGRNAVSLTGKVFGGVFSTLTVIIISFYLLLYYDRFKSTIAGLFRKDMHPHVIETIEQIDDKLGAWLRGQILLSFSIGLVTYILLSILHLPYALPLALLAGILEIVPTLGPIIAAVPAVIVALTISPTMGITVALVYVLIQLLENNILVPKIMERAVGLNPIIVILAVMIGANLMGVIGALLSIPFVSFLTVLFHSINTTEKKT
jgi:predicted PurR-regulated permease PerM